MSSPLHSVALVSLALAGCSVPFGDPLPDAPDTDTGGDSADTGETGETGTPGDTTVVGVVVGVDGLPLGGVTVRHGSDEQVTGTDGAFSFQGDAPMALTFSRVGLHEATRTFGHSVQAALVGLQPARAPQAFDASVGASVTVAGATLEVPAESLGRGLVAVTLDPFDLDAGIHSLPAGALDASGNVLTAIAAATVRLEGASGALTPAAPLVVRLPVTADTPGTTASVYSASGGSWVEVGSATIADVGGGEYLAVFSVSEGGTYAVGRLDSSGCISGKVVDGAGADAPAAHVRSYVRPVAAGRASWVDEAVAGADGSFCVTGSAGASALYVEYEDGAGGHWSGVATTAAAGDPDTCESCTDVGNVALTASGCATGNLYAANGAAMPVSPFAWDEGGFAMSAADSTLTFYARAGTALHLVGPGGLAKNFSVSAGTTPEAATCTRLGNLQAPQSCVTVDVADPAGALGAIPVQHASGAWSTTDADGNVCLSSDDGSTTYTAQRTLGGQMLEVSAAATVEAVAGSCQTGECFAGPSLAFGEAGCVQGVVYGEGGAPAAGVQLWSSTWDSATTGSDGSYSLATGGAGTAALWGDEWALTTFDDQPASAGCTVLDLYADAGTPPPLVVAMDKYAWQVTGGGSTESTLVGAAVVSFTDVQADVDADLLLGLLNVYAWSGDATGAGWANFGSSSALWSSLRIAPDSTQVALQGYGSNYAGVWVYDLDGDVIRQLSTTSGTDVDGLAFSEDGAWLASTRRDGGIEVTPVNGSRAPVTIAASPCAHPVWWDLDTVALECGGDVHLYEMDGSSHVSFLTTGETDRVWALTSTARVVYSSGDELHIANIDLSDDQVLYTGNPGVGYARVRVSEDGLWVAAIVQDPIDGTDVVAVPDQAPYTPVWLTDTPTEAETSIDWLE